jgi:hypothetical protein
VAGILEQNPHLPESYWWEFMLDTYGTTQVVARATPGRPRADVVSLARLIAKIRDDIDRLTKEWWLGLSGAPPHPMRFETERQWAEHFGRSLGDHRDPAIPTTEQKTEQRLHDANRRAKLIQSPRSSEARSGLDPGRAMSAVAAIRQPDALPCSCATRGPSPSSVNTTTSSGSEACPTAA